MLYHGNVWRGVTATAAGVRMVGGCRRRRRNIITILILIPISIHHLTVYGCMMIIRIVAIVVGITRRGQLLLLLLLW